MSHELTQRKDGFVEMAYFGEAPWHRLGQELTLEETLMPEVVLQKAGMDWDIKRSRVRFGDGTQLFEDHHVLFRSDTKEPLAVVGKKYQIVQPRHFIMDFLSPILSATGFRLHTAGTMFGGKRFWALASIGEGATIMGANDKVDGYLLLSTSADGTLATSARFTTVRVVCNNTLSMALSTKSASDVKVSHRTAFDPVAVRAQLGIVTGAFGQFIDASRKLALTTVNLKEAKELTAALLIDSKTVTKADVEASSGFKSILSLFDHGKGNHGETAWDWVNGVTEYVDHVQRSKSESHRMANSMFGKGDSLKTMALERAIALI